MEKKRNNSSWCCDEIEKYLEKLKEKRKTVESSGTYYKSGIIETLDTIIADLTRILYE